MITKVIPPEIGRVKSIIKTTARETLKISSITALHLHIGHLIEVDAIQIPLSYEKLLFDALGALKQLYNIKFHKKMNYMSSLNAFKPLFEEQHWANKISRVLNNYF